jgi:hypothetical protein
MSTELHWKLNAIPVNQEVKPKHFEHFGATLEFCDHLKGQIFEESVPEYQLKNFVAVSIALYRNIFPFVKNVVNWWKITRMTFSHLMDWTLVVNIEKWDMEDEAVVWDVEQQVLVVFGKLNQLESEACANKRIKF